MNNSHHVRACEVRREQEPVHEDTALPSRTRVRGATAPPQKQQKQSHSPITYARARCDDVSYKPHPLTWLPSRTRVRGATNDAINGSSLDPSHHVRACEVRQSQPPPRCYDLPPITYARARCDTPKQVREAVAEAPITYARARCDSTRRCDQIQIEAPITYARARCDAGPSLRNSWDQPPITYARARCDFYVRISGG